MRRISSREAGVCHAAKGRITMQIIVDQSLKEVGGHVSRVFRPAPDELTFEEVEFGKKPIRVEVDLQNSGDRLIGAITVQCELRLECSRCVERAGFAVEADREIQYVQNPTPDMLKSELGGWFVSAYDGERVVIDEDVRQMLLLAVPMRFLCREDCKGLCSRCGANLNAGSCACPVAVESRAKGSPFQAAFEELKRKKKL